MIPQPTAKDLARDAEADYDPKTPVLPWIRRCVAAEARAVAAEAALAAATVVRCEQADRKPLAERQLEQWEEQNEQIAATVKPYRELLAELAAAKQEIDDLNYKVDDRNRMVERCDLREKELCEQLAAANAEIERLRNAPCAHALADQWAKEAGDTE